MEFSGTDEPLPPQRPPRAAPSRAQRHQPSGGEPPRRPSGELLRRRLVALVIGALLVVILLFAVRGCLDAREERNYENYLRDLSSIVSTSQQLSQSFFARLDDPGGSSVLELRQHVGASRGTGEDLLRRVEGLDAPGDLAEAQSDLEVAFELRRDGLTSIADHIDTALGDAGRREAIDEIAADMRAFLASDVLYARAEAEIERIVAEQEIEVDNPDDALPTSRFLPEPPEQYIDSTQLAGLLAAVAADTGAAGSGTHGTEIASTVLKPGNLSLSPDTLNEAAAGAAPELEVSVLNGGTDEETDVIVSYELSGSVVPLAGETTIPRISAGGTETATLPVTGEIATGQELTLTVSVLPVPGETIVDNNESVYPIIFE